MNRRVKAGLLLVRWVGLGSIVLAPRMAFAAAAPRPNCSNTLERCTDNAITIYNDCTCYVDSGDTECFTVTVPNQLPTSVSTCVASLQGDVFKCQAANVLCTLIPASPGANRR